MKAQGPGHHGKEERREKERKKKELSTYPSRAYPLLYLISRSLISKVSFELAGIPD
jgi:hypothetical protein